MTTLEQSVVRDEGLNTINVDDNVAAAVKRYGTNQSALIPILQEMQEQYRYLPKDVLNSVAEALQLSPATVYGVATFYAQFSLEPKGKYVIKVCDGTACHVRGSLPVYEAICERVGLEKGKSTTKNRRYTIETVSCLGACGLAPVVTINDKVYGQMTPQAIVMILDMLEEEETSHA
ncbi:MAG: NADH-quinone oxidoreductase subunit NuoE [Firmicutes bacterium]|jgi:NADH-quinone oxidoreductase subunit E|nr:NADH-quinone oxidoreductase subunit NuoE [Bacillota bacterium]